ncbi:Glycosyltransferase, catalytic subunit of cellulose synthase and poly-beta-1,6-N-acetylglucosamine synthase [Fervidobacterium changbaicum]|uniref:Glycosyltransferase family 2 protein n=2 Tax=Fervidobacterium TaxID=2422 RepID=A0AAI8CK31_FERIS|nr:MULTISPECIES: glycosyltransferase family 2 protein [Fervidobacterium]AMW32024.1 glycosyltransferase family 2 protein [Fervidobacterium islandicum]QAV33807.1 glycosyltransferase family 2 protein [Fervidobacterium changbaicum]SDH67540.1 Glycosyltransferase, catalytic subunit of cellulose synthase and poly-beta-1,6-N-acetylglucosamine synthase [Fervidobacterium changbaicum]
MSQNEPLVSVVLPVRNEEKTVSKTIESLLENEYENIEIIVVDGMSTDKTRQIVERYIEKHPGKIKLLENPKRHTPAGLNIGIQNASGEYIMIASGHATYSSNYISTCVNVLEQNMCDVAGGLMETLPRSNTPKAIAIAEVLKHPFGVGGAKYRTGAQKNEYVDTVAYGIYKKEIFEKVGLFDERLTRNQDIEFNIRLKDAGYRIMLVPQAKVYYFARDTFKGLWQNNFSNGFWVTHSRKHVKKAYKLRHLIPLFFVIYLLILAVTLSILVIPTFFKLLGLVPLSLYLAMVTIFSASVSTKHNDNSIFFYTLTSFLILHISYGTGSLVGLVKKAE